MSLKDLREEANLSQSELGSRLHALLPDTAETPEYFQPRISSYESGRNRIPLPVAVAIVRVLNDELEKQGVETRATVEGLLHEKHELPKRRKKKARR